MTVTCRNAVPLDWTPSGVLWMRREVANHHPGSLPASTGRQWCGERQQLKSRKNMDGLDGVAGLLPAPRANPQGQRSCKGEWTSPWRCCLDIPNRRHLRYRCSPFPWRTNLHGTARNRRFKLHSTTSPSASEWAFSVAPSGSCWCGQKTNAAGRPGQVGAHKMAGPGVLSKTKGSKGN